jgi:tetratricopeptide (TPR) repeat protein
MRPSEQGKNGRAIELFDKLIQKDPSENNFGSKGACLLKLGRTEDAIKNLRVGLRYNPKSVDLTVFFGAPVE